MKLSFSFVVILIFVFLSCKKDVTTNVALPTSKMGLLTAKQWIFDTVYMNYTGPGTGKLIYARGANNNTVNYDQARFVYWPDGIEDDFNFISTMTWTPITWSFSNADSTTLYYPSIAPLTVPVYERILLLNNTHVTFYDSTNSRLDIAIYKP